jgi:hypothetical protein
MGGEASNFTTSSILLASRKFLGFYNLKIILPDAAGKVWEALGRIFGRPRSSRSSDPPFLVAPRRHAGGVNVKGGEHVAPRSK